MGITKKMYVVVAEECNKSGFDLVGCCFSEQQAADLAGLLQRVTNDKELTVKEVDIFP